MIKINLCPVDELESPYWYVPDVLALVAVAVAAYLGVQAYFGQIEAEVQSVATESMEKKDAYDRLERDVRPYKTLAADIETLKGKIVALQSITVSKISRYQPVIVLEHLQTLRPEGVWFESFTLGQQGDPNRFLLKGQAFDNLLVAELMTSIRRTESDEKDDADLRTQVFFDAMTLLSTNIGEGGGGTFPELAIYPRFELTGGVRERTAAASFPEPPTVKPPAPEPAPEAPPAGESGPTEVSRRGDEPDAFRF